MNPTTLDYRAIEALHTVIELQSFEAAANKLFITQSAISQRIKALETHYGKPVLVRIHPYHPTPLGELLIAHFKKVRLLEQSLNQTLEPKAAKPTIPLAINQDSLDTWFLDIINNSNIFSNFLLEIISDDQELTLNYLKKGLVSACVSTSKKSIQGATVTFLGNMDYLLVATPKFEKQYFNSSNHTNNLLNAPAILYDINDLLHHKYLEKYFKIESPQFSRHYVPSTHVFKYFAINHLGYGLIPKIDILKELQSNTLINLFPKKTWKVPLYWHHWTLQSKIYQDLNHNIIQQAKTRLSLKNEITPR